MFELVKRSDSETEESEFECCGCCLAEHSVQFVGIVAALAHLQEHTVAGHKVPQSAIDRLLSELLPQAEPGQT